MNKKSLSKQLKNQQGFTLIELLVVIGIIAVLAAIVLIAINPARQFKQARDAQRRSDVNAILNAIGQYTADNKGNLPSAITALAVNTPKDISKADANLCATLVTNYMPALAIDPSTGTDPKTDKDDDQVSKAECGDGYNTKYQVARDADGRVTVSAPDTEIATPDIAVTR